MTGDPVPTLGWGGVTVVSGGTLDLNGKALTIAGGLYDGGSGGTVTNTSAIRPTVTLTVDYNGTTTDSFADTITGSFVSVVKTGDGTFSLAGSNGYGGRTEVDEGTLQDGNSGGVPGNGELIVNATTDPGSGLPGGHFDLDGNSLTVQTLNGAGSSSYTASDDAVITNSDPGSQATLTVAGGGHFGGRIVDGLGAVGLNVGIGGTGSSVILTNVKNNYSLGTELNDGSLYLGDGTHADDDGMVTGAIYAYDTGNVVFQVAGSVVFTGSITSLFPGESGCSVIKSGSGTLAFDATAQDNYGAGTIVDGGTMVLESTNVIPQGTSIQVLGGSELDLGGFTDMPAVGDVTLSGGSITDGTLNLAAGSTLTVDSGQIDADVSGDASLVAGTGAAVLSGNCSQLIGDATVSSGASLQVDGPLGASPVTVDSGATLSGSGSLQSVIVDGGGTLALGAATGPSTITIGALTLDSGSVIDDYLGSEDAYLADIIGQLTIYAGTTVDFPNPNASGTVPFQMLFQYGSLQGSFNNLGLAANPPANASLFNDTSIPSIDLMLRPVVYWAPNGSATLGGIGSWDATSDCWSASPTGSSPGIWQPNDITIFQGTGTVTIDNGFTADPAAMLFIGGD